MGEFDYLISAREIKGSKFGDEPGKLRYLKVPKNADQPLPEHAVPGKRKIDWLKEIQGLADGDGNPLSISPSGDVLVFVHGYNNDPRIVLERQRLLAANLRAEQWRGVVVSFDWPSGDSTLGYYEDRSDAAQVAVRLVSGGIKLLSDGQKEGCITNVHVLGHSTGAYVIMEAFVQAEKDGELFKGDWRVGQVGLIAGDVAMVRLAATDQWARPMFRRIMRLTNYSNHFDSVLAVSNAKRLGVEPRVGRVGLPADADPKSINVDCSDYFQKLDPAEANGSFTFNHSWHFTNRVFARDFAMTMEGAIDRRAIPTRLSKDGNLYLGDGERPAHLAAWGIDLVKRQRLAEELQRVGKARG